MAGYRLYRMRGMVLTGSREIEAGSDAEAILDAREWARPGHVVEVWRGHRRVRIVGPTKVYASPAA